MLKNKNKKSEFSLENPRLAVVIPSYKVKNHIVELIRNIGSEISNIYVVDDKCPEFSGDVVKKNIKDKRVQIIFHPENLGVGGAVKSGYLAALKDGADIVIKLDGDGQMNPDLIPHLILPILRGVADYVKGNRFYNIEGLSKMPILRLFGNSMLSLVNKFVSGYWNIMDPTNGFTAIHRQALSLLPLQKIENRYFFESDMLFRLGIIRAVVQDMPMESHYADEKSSLSIRKVLFEFPLKYINRFFKRIFYNYFLRDFYAATFELLFGMPLVVFGAWRGWSSWNLSMITNQPATSGKVMLAALPIIIGFQLLLDFLSFDIQNVPKVPLSQS